ncbi:unnamed protein product, partial [Vitis vinifera]
MKKMWFKTSSKPEIQYLSQYHTTVKTPRLCEREALTRKCEREGTGTTVFSFFFSILLFVINYNFRI